MKTKQYISASTDALTRFADQALVSLGNFATALLVARLLGPEQFGSFALLWIVVTAGLSCHWALITSPMQVTLPQTLSTNRTELLGALLSHAVGIATITAICGAAVLVIMSPVMPGLWTIASVLFSLTLIIIQEFARRWLLGTERPEWALTSDMLRYVGSVALLWVVGFRGEAESLSLCMWMIGLCSFVALLPLGRELAKIRFVAASVARYGRQHITFGQWLLPSVVLQSISSGAPIYILHQVVGSPVSGGYRAALNLMAPIVSLTEALETFLPLRCSDALARGGNSAVQRKLWQWALPLWGVCGAFALLVWVKGGFLLLNLYGEAFEKYAPALLPLGVAMSLQFGTYALNVRLRTFGRARAIFVADCLATFCLVALMLLLPLDAVGTTAAWSVVVAQFVKLASLSTASIKLSHEWVKGNEH